MPGMSALPPPALPGAARRCLPLGPREVAPVARETGTGIGDGWTCRGWDPRGVPRVGGQEASRLWAMGAP